MGLDEMVQAARERTCARYGHNFAVRTDGSNDPAVVACLHCKHEWPLGVRNP